MTINTYYGLNSPDFLIEDLRVFDGLIVSDSGEISLYLQTKTESYPDLEIAAAAAIQWALGLKAAALSIDIEHEYRVTFVQAKPGSLNWLARVERSKIDKFGRSINRTWKRLPISTQVPVLLAIWLFTTGKPAFDAWFKEDKFSEAQLAQMYEVFQKAQENALVKTHRQAMYRELSRDPTITGVGTGLPNDENWKPATVIPSEQFAEAEGLFEPKEAEQSRVFVQTLDVLIVKAHLDNVPKSWEFKQEGIPGTFTAVMRDKSFLTALDQSTIHETLRTKIPMRIVLETRQEKVNGEWKDRRGGRSVIQVLSPQID